MKFQRHIKMEQGFEQIEIIPLIDTILLVFVFFMLTNSLTVQDGINVKLPKSITSDVLNDDTSIVTITSENVLYLNGKVSTLKELSNELVKIAPPNRPLVIKVDRRASMGRIVDVWNLCRKLGIERINIATNQDK